MQMGRIEPLTSANHQNPVVQLRSPAMLVGAYLILGESCAARVPSKTYLAS